MPQSLLGQCDIWYCKQASNHLLAQLQSQGKPQLAPAAFASHLFLGTGVFLSAFNEIILPLQVSFVLCRCHITFFH